MTNAQLTLLIRAQNQTSSELAKLRSDLAGLDKPARDASAGIKKTSDGIGRLQNIAKAGLALKGVQETVGFLSSAAKAAAADEASQKQLQVAIENTGVAYSSYAAQLEKTISHGQKLAFTDDQTRESISLLAAETGNASEAIRRYALAQDLARGTGMDVVAASRLLGKVTDENTRVLARYGITVRKGADDTELLAAVQERFGGQAAAFADTAAGKMARFNDRVAEAQELLGSALLPTLVRITDAGNLVFDALDKIPSFADKLDKQTGKLGVFRVALAGIVSSQTAGIIDLFPKKIKDTADAVAKITPKPVDDLGNAFDTAKGKVSNFNRSLSDVSQALSGLGQAKTPEQLKLQGQVSAIDAEIAKQKVLLDESQRTGRKFTVVTAEGAQTVRDANIDVAKSYTRLQEAQQKYNEVAPRTKDGDLEFQKVATDLVEAQNEYRKSLDGRARAERDAVVVVNADAVAIQKNIDNLQTARDVFSHQFDALQASRKATEDLAQSRVAAAQASTGAAQGEGALNQAIDDVAQAAIDQAKKAGQAAADFKAAQDGLISKAREVPPEIAKIGAAALGNKPNFFDMSASFKTSADTMVADADRVAKAIAGITAFANQNPNNILGNAARAVLAGSGNPIPGQASGTPNFPGGWTWVGEQGAELMRLPRGTQVMSHPMSMAYAGHLASGNVSAGDFSGGDVGTLLPPDRWVPGTDATDWRNWSGGNVGHYIPAYRAQQGNGKTNVTVYGDLNVYTSGGGFDNAFARI